ncbi:MAG TPA: 4-alpha-glucanotransferase, partial [Cytophagales bacterium]|nr:4-alpha-glucanotransferase [Cytophagales bacterium]
DSADVWQRPELFVVDGEGNVAGQAGVPPDYFSEDGQLWGMPVYNWEAIKSHDYDWWVQRIRKNMELYDILRLDHFRAFSTYWEVPAGEKTAKKGEWKKGPGAEFFQKLEQELGQLPLVAEDLGDIDDEVIKLRETFDMPGLKVLQFGFTKMDGWIDHIPHHYTPNFVVYTGNHDNNTTVGWFRKETDQQDHEKIKAYVGDLDISEKNIHLIMARMAYASVANMVVIPVQDLMGLDESARINKPGTVKDNWSWRLKPQQLKPQVADLLKKWVVLYDREDKTPLEKPNGSNASDIRT